MRVAFALALIPAVLIGFMASPATAQDTGVYIGAAFGQAKHKDACEGADISCDETDSAWKLFGGYQFSRFLAVELGYADLGQSKASGTVGAVTVDAAFEVTAWELVAVGSFPVMDRLSVLGKFGLYRADIELSGSGRIGAGTPIPFSGDESNNEITFGVGARYDFTRNLGLRAEWQRYKKVGGDETGEVDIDLISAGLIWRF
jgi:OmpA-OmpF porin, OOP family